MRLATVALLAAPLLLSACNTMRFEVGDGAVSEVVRQRKSFFVGGLVPTRNVDVARHCENGAVAIREETTFGDGFFNLITLGIYTPRTSWYYCAAPEFEEDAS